jgi:hypothetical protein
VEGLEISVAAGRVRVRPLREGAGEAVLLDRLGERVQALQPCVNHYAWGGDVLPALLGRSRGEPAQPTAEAWLTSTQKDGPVALVATPLTLAEWVSERPEILGPWSRAIFGDRSPVFLKFLSTRFPPRVHMGFDPAAVAALGPGGVEFPALFRSWLEREQELLRELFAALDTARLRTAERFDRFRSVYEHWAVEQSLAGWRHGAADAGFVARLAPFLAAGAEPPRLEALVRRLRENRARTVALFNEVSLEEEVGNALLSPAGMPHAIFGLSHQGHPRDHAAARLRELFAELAARRAAGAAEAELLERARAVRPELDELRAANRDDPKSEAWIPFRAGGEVLIAEPQQTSNCTYSWLDLYTPFVFRDGRTLFRKGDPARGVAPEALDEFLAELDFEPAAVESFRCRPRELGLTAPHRAARLYAVVDDGVVWPYFTAHRLELGGRPREPASFRGDHPRGAFQEIVVLAGSATVTSGPAGCRTLLAPGVPAFVPATLEGGYTLESEEEATLLLVSVPRPGGSSPVA